MPTSSIAKKVVQRLTDAGFTAYFAGGWVRDFLMQRPSDDIDIATSASVQDVQAIFPKTIPVGVAFGIVIVVQDDHQFEVATFRKDRGYVDGRRPTGIDPATADEDAVRRDFTINGMFYDPLKNELLDYVGGQEDIKRGIIRAIGDPHERFMEDRLRMMRAVRYSTRFEFPIDEETIKAILAHAESLIPAVAMERVWQEFKKMSQFAHFDTGLIHLHRLNLLPTIFPQLKGISIEEITRRVKAIPHFPKNTPTIAELLELFPSISLNPLIEICEYLKLSNQEKDFVSYLHHSNTLLNLPTSWQMNVEPIEWAYLYAHPQAEICLGIAGAHLSYEKKEHFFDVHAKRRQALAKAIERIKTKNPVLRAEDLMKEGVPAGKKLGKLLTEAERISVNEGIEDKNILLNELKKSNLWKTQDV